MRSKTLLLGSFIALLAVPAMAQGNNAINLVGTVDKVDAASITVKMEESTETVKIVRAMRALMVDKGLDREQWKIWNRLTNEFKNEPVLGVEGEQIASLVAFLDLESLSSFALPPTLPSSLRESKSLDDFTITSQEPASGGEINR